MASVKSHVWRRAGLHLTTDIPLLISELRSPNAVDREIAREALVAAGKAATRALVEALSDSHVQVRWEAAKALICLTDPSAIPALVVALGDEQAGIRWLAAEALVALGPVSLEPVLKALTDPAKVSWLREGARHVLHELARQRPAARLGPVLDALEDFEPGLTVPLAALRALRALRACS